MKKKYLPCIHFANTATISIPLNLTHRETQETQIKKISNTLLKSSFFVYSNFYADNIVIVRTRYFRESFTSHLFDLRRTRRRSQFSAFDTAGCNICRMGIYCHIPGWL